MSKKNEKKKLEVAQEWKKLLVVLFPKGCKLPPLQRVEMKRAFYGGFGQAIVLMFEKIDKMGGEEGTKAIDALYKEVELFWSRQIQYDIKPEEN